MTPHSEFVKVGKDDIIPLFWYMNCSKGSVQIADRTFICPHPTFIKEHIRLFNDSPYDPSNKYKNKAVQLLAHFSGKGYAFGWAYVFSKDVCFFIDNIMRIWFVEPHSGIMIRPYNNFDWLVLP